MHDVRTERERRVSVVRGSGELDAYAAPDLEAALAQFGDEGRILVDLEQVSVMDSTALGVVVRHVRALTERGADVRVVLPRGTARRIFEITALDGVLPVVGVCARAVDVYGGLTLVEGLEL